jgi:hypothetical protein
MPSYVPTLVVGMYAPSGQERRHAKLRHVCATRRGIPVVFLETADSHSALGSCKLELHCACNLNAAFTEDLNDSSTPVRFLGQPTGASGQIQRSPLTRLS